MAARRLTRDELEKRLAPYKCVCIQEFQSGLEIWETGWGEPFTLWREDGYYDLGQYFRLVGTLIAMTMPPDWNNNR